MIYQEGGLSIVMRAAGIRCVTVAGMKKKQGWSVTLSAMIPVMSATPM